MALAILQLWNSLLKMHIKNLKNNWKDLLFFLDVLWEEFVIYVANNTDRLGETLSDILYKILTSFI